MILASVYALEINLPSRQTFFTGVTLLKVLETIFVMGTLASIQVKIRLLKLTIDSKLSCFPAVAISVLSFSTERQKTMK